MVTESIRGSSALVWGLGGAAPLWTLPLQEACPIAMVTHEEHLRAHVRQLEVQLEGWHACADAMASRHGQSPLVCEEAQEMSGIGGGDALQGCSAAAQDTLGQPSYPASALFSWSGRAAGQGHFRKHSVYWQNTSPPAC